MISFNNLGNYGRLGNQMFQYASLRGIAANRGFDFCIPPPDVFGVNDPNVKNSKSNIHNTFDISLVKQGMLNNPMVQESCFEFDQNLFDTCDDNVDLLGYFQSEKYFIHIEDDIRKDFSFHQDIINECEEFIKTEICDNNLISLHIRRGDYLNLTSHHPIPSLDYYQYCLDKLPDVPVLIFSDDVDWCMEQKLFENDRFFISNTNSEKQDMCLMSMCSYHIIANSSFSWWGAWLSKSKKVFAPKDWFGHSLMHFNTKDLYVNGWELV